MSETPRTPSRLAIVIGSVAVCFAEGGSRLATSGGPYGYIEFALGPLAGFVAGNLLWLGDVLACGDERGLRSPLCDAVMLAAAARLLANGLPVLAGIFGIGCDAELTPAEVLARMARVAAAGGLCGVRGLTHLRQILSGMGVLVVAEQLAVPSSGNAFDASGALQNPVQHAAIEAIGTRVEHLARAMREGR